MATSNSSVSRPASPSRLVGVDNKEDNEDNIELPSDVTVLHLAVCGVSQDDLRADYGLKSLSPCPACKHEVYKHLKAAGSSIRSTSSASSTSSSSSRVVPKEVFSSLPIWKSEHRTMRPFLQKFKNLMISSDIDKSQWSRIIIRCFNNTNDQNWVRQEIHEKDLDWDQATRELSTHFDSADYHEQLYLTYKKLMCRHKESVQKYSDRFKSICSELGYVTMILMLFNISLLVSLRR